jgi:hypothetical protein
MDDILRKVFEQHGSCQGLTGIDRGYKYQRKAGTGAPVRTDEVVVRFLVRKKKTEEELVQSEEPILPKDFLGMRTDVIEAPLDFLRAKKENRGVPAAGKPSKAPTDRFNPIQPGISVSQGNQGAGTLGAIVYLEDGRPAILSCWHVLAFGQARKGDPVYQPSPVDGGDVRFDAVAHLDRWIIDQDGDAAIAVLSNARMRRRQQLGTGVVLDGAREAEVGNLLTKSGRGTGVCQALVDGVGRYLLNLTGEGAIEVEGFRLVPTAKRGSQREISGPGDSGAVWYSTDNGQALGVGLLIDGEVTDQEPEYAVACHLPRVLTRLGVSLSPPVDGTAALRNRLITGAPGARTRRVWPEEEWLKLTKDLVATLESSATQPVSTPR